jgi:hypothetical protein
MSPNPPTLQIAPWVVLAALSEWSIALVKLAIAEHDEGRFESSAQLAEAMLVDPQIAGDINARTRELASRSALPFKVEPSDEGDGRKVEAVAREQQALWWTAHPESTIAAVQRDAITLRVSVGWIEWFRDSRSWAPRLHHLPAHGLRLEADGTWHYIDAAGVDHLVTPGDGRWFLHLPDGDRSWIMGAVRALGIPFALDALALRAFSQFCERHGQPTLAVYESFATSDNVEGADGNGSKAFYQRVHRQLRGGILRLPQPDNRETPGNDAKWLELASKGDCFERLIVELRRRKALAVLGRDPDRKSSLGGDGESATRQQKSEYLASDAETIATSLREQVWKWWALFNHGDPKLAGWGRWDTRLPLDTAARAATLKTGAEAIAGLEAQGVDTDPVVVELGLKRRAGWKPPDLSKPAPTPAQGQPTADPS